MHDPAYIRLYVGLHTSGLNLLTLHGLAGHGLNHILSFERMYLPLCNVPFHFQGVKVSCVQGLQGIKLMKHIQAVEAFTIYLSTRTY